MSTDPRHRPVEDLGQAELLELLRTHGRDVNALPSVAGRTEPVEPVRAYEVVPLRDGWLRVGTDGAGRTVGGWVEDPAHPGTSVGPALTFDEQDADDLDGWLRCRLDVDGGARRWVSVVRRPEREAYVALVYDRAPAGPVRRHVVPGVYPDVTLCDEDGTSLAFVEPVRGTPGATRAVIARLTDDFDAGRHVVRDSADGGLGLRPCSVRRFVKLSHGVRTLRLWDLVDVRADRPAPISVPGVADDPDLFDVGLLDDELVLVQAANHAGRWTLLVSVVEDGQVLDGWRAADGPGTVLEVVAGRGCALVRVRVAPGGADADARDTGTDAEQVMLVPLGTFSTAASLPLRSTDGLFSLALNTVTPAVGFGALELQGGADPVGWYFGTDGRLLNPGQDLVGTGGRERTRKRTEQVASVDGYLFTMDLRWRSEDDSPFTGPVLLMVYGAYGLDIDLDADRDLGRWLDQGFAVATPHVRGGGPPARHLAGCRSRRDRSVADAAAAVRWLRSGIGTVRATRLCVVGASAGGFLAATTLATCPDDVDACVVVNGFVDPLTSLRRGDTLTAASDRDEWGDPDDPEDHATLLAVSPAELGRAGRARVLVVVSACDVRVNPRQGLAWYLRYRDLGGEATLWFDPVGAHDCWGASMDPGAMTAWVVDALDLG